MDHEVPKFCFLQDITHTIPNRMPLQAENFRSHESDGREEDLKIISQWVRKELFVKVKFLYDVEEDLAVNGIIYNHFVRDCKLGYNSRSGAFGRVLSYDGQTLMRSEDVGHRFDPFLVQAPFRQMPCAFGEVG